MSGNLSLQLRLTGDASNLKAAVVSATEAVQQVGPAAQAGAGQATAAINRLGASHQAATVASAALSRQTGITRQQMQQLAPQLNDVFTTLSMGASPMQVAIQQGGQITQVFGGIGPTMRAFAGALGAGGIAALAFGGAAALVVTHGASLQAQQRTLAVAIQGTGRSAEVSTQQLQAFIRQLERAGAADANQVVANLARTQGLSSEDIGRSVTLGPSLAAVAGTEVAAGVQQLADAFRAGYEGIRKLDEQLNFLTATEREQIRVMLEHGQRAEGMRLASDRLARQIGGADKAAVSGTTVAFREMTGAWTEFMDAVSQSGPVLLAMKALELSVRGVAGVVKSATPAGEADQLQRRIKALEGQLADKDSYGAPTVGGEARRALEAQLSALRGQLGGVRNLSGPITGGAASAPDVQDTAKAAAEIQRQAKLVDTLTLSYQDQQRVMSVGITQRAQMVARIQAERDADLHSIVGKERDELIRRRVAEVAQQEAAAREADLVAMTAETAAAIAAANASDQGRAAMMRASAAAEAHAQAATQSQTAENALAKALLNRNAAQIAVSGADQALQLREQAEGAERVAAALRNGFQAGRVAEVEEQVRQLTAQLRAAAEATDDPRLKVVLGRLSGSIGSSVVRSDQAAQSRQLAEMQLGQRQEMEKLALRERLSSGFTSGGEAARQLADLQAVHDLERARLSTSSEQAQEYRRQAQAISQLTLQVQGQEAAWSEVAGAARDAFADVGRQIMTDLKNGELGFKTLENVGMSVAEKLLSKFMELAIINPLLNSFGLGGGGLPSLGGLFGLGGGASTAGAGALPVPGPFLLGSIFHDGGMVGGAAPGRMVPIDLFRHAPRMHTGGYIGPDERPIIARVGEHVLTPEQMAGMGGSRVSVPITFHGDAGSPADRRRLKAMVEDAVDAGIARRAPQIAAVSTAATMSAVKRGGDAARVMGR